MQIEKGISTLPMLLWTHNGFTGLIVQTGEVCLVVREREDESLVTVVGPRRLNRGNRRAEPTLLGLACLVGERCRRAPVVAVTTDAVVVGDSRLPTLALDGASGDDAA